MGEGCENCHYSKIKNEKNEIEIFIRLASR